MSKQPDATDLPLNHSGNHLERIKCLSWTEFYEKRMDRRPSNIDSVELWDMILKRSVSGAECSETDPESRCGVWGRIYAGQSQLKELTAEMSQRRCETTIKAARAVLREQGVIFSAVEENKASYSLFESFFEEVFRLDDLRHKRLAALKTLKIS